MCIRDRILGQNRAWAPAITAFSVALLLAAAGCGPSLTSGAGNSVPQATASSIQFKPSNLDFQTQPIGTQSAAQLVELVNVTGSSVTVQSVTVSPAGVFAVVEPASNTVIAPHASLVLSVSFTPKQEATYSGSVSVTLAGVDPTGQTAQPSRIIPTPQPVSELPSHYSFPLTGFGSGQSKGVSLSISPALSLIHI